MLIGEEAHIVAGPMGGPRAGELDQGHDGYENLILLCPEHHLLIDSQPERFAVEDLRRLKAEHEAWVEERLVRLPSHGSSRAGHGQRPLVLYVEDNPRLQGILRPALERRVPDLEFRWFPALAPFTEALSDLGGPTRPSIPPSVVVTGLWLASGEMEGIQVAHAARGRGIPVLGLIGLVPGSSRLRSELSDFEALYSMDAELPELVERVALLIESQQGHSPPGAEEEGVSSAASPPSERPAPAVEAVLSEPGERLADVVPELEVVDLLDPGAAGIVTATVENLLGQVRHHLLAGSWAVGNGFAHGVEEDIRGDVDELERQLRPLSGRPVSTVMIQALVARVSENMFELAEREARDEAHERVRYLREQVIGRVAALDGTDRDVGAAVEAMDALAFAAGWADMEQPERVADDEWKLFVEVARQHPSLVLGGLVGWIPRSPQEAASAVLGGMTTAGGIGFFAQAVATWVGMSTPSAAGVAFSGGLLGAALGAVVGVLAVRFVVKDDVDHEG